MQIKLNRAFTHTLNSLPRGRLHTSTINNTCNIPWKHVTIDLNGNVLLCECDAWLPIPVGKVEDFDSLQSVFNSEAAKFLQQNITDKKFTWCAVEHCGIVHRNITKTKFSMVLNLDESCNLSCPSCRRDQIMIDSGPEYDVKIHRLQIILSWLSKFEEPIYITLSGNGDPLASKIIRPLIQSYQPKAQQSFNFKTNGLLMKKLLPDSPIQKFIRTYSISVDAATKEVYEKVRRPGKWDILIENLDWLKQNKGSAWTVLDFVIQKDNLSDVEAFADLCQSYNFAGHYSALFDWGTWNSRPVLEPDAYTIQNGTFLDHDVADVAHPAHEEFVTIINRVRNKKVPLISFQPSFSKFFDATR